MPIAYNASSGEFYGTEPGALETFYFATAFILGFFVLQIDLPPMVGFILSGFVLNAAGFPHTEAIEVVEKLGQSLLLFSIGLKLSLKTLTKVQVFVPAVLHVGIMTSIFAGFILMCGAFGVALFTQVADPATAFLLGFSFSFSSTVFAIKVLEERGELSTYHAKVSIGILVMQDLFAVIFLSVMTGRAPTLYALTLFLLPVVQRVLFLIIDRSKHGEILTMCGLSISLVLGYVWFDAVGLKGDLGVLVIGVLIKPHKKSSELSKSFLKIKDLFLVGFFLSTGLKARLSIEAFYVAVIFVLVLPIKTFFYYVCTNITYMRARTSLLCAFTLANYSEFGLLVTLQLAKTGMIESDWLAVAAMAISITFFLASPLNAKANWIYVKMEDVLLRLECKERLDEEKEVDIGEATILILGMGRIGQGVYNSLVRNTFTHKDLLGIDDNPDLVLHLRGMNRTVKLADATDPDFWKFHNFSKVQLIIFAFPKAYQSIECLEELESAEFYNDWNGTLAAVARYGDDKQKLKERYNVHILYDLYAEAGNAFADYVFQQWQSRKLSIISEELTKSDEAKTLSEATDATNESTNDSTNDSTGREVTIV